jgi:glycosyltransferase involved in cell wall biosynthesis
MWNEEEIISRTVAAAREAGERLIAEAELGTYEILIVDDASTDATGTIADRLAAEDPHIRVVHHSTNRKLGGSLKTGFGEATGALVLYTDADLPFDLLEVSKAVRLLRVYEADIVSAYRHDRTGEGPRRLVYSYAYNQLVQRLLGLRIRDVNFACKLLRREVLEKVALRSEGSFIDVELLARAEAAGFRTIQFGVDYFPRTRGVSTLSSWPVIRKILGEGGDLLLDLRGALRRSRGGPPPDDVADQSARTLPGAGA